jgi:hypothetical protein
MKLERALFHDKLTLRQVGHANLAFQGLQMKTFKFTLYKMRHDDILWKAEIWLIRPSEAPVRFNRNTLRKTATFSWSVCIPASRRLFNT